MSERWEKKIIKSNSISKLYIGFYERDDDADALGTCFCVVVAWFELCGVLSGSGKVSIVN